MKLPDEPWPEKTGDLYDLLQRDFGIGGSDVGTEFWRVRMVEIGKMNRIMTSRKASIEQVAIAAWYAKEVRAHCYGVGQLCALIPLARKAYLEALVEQRRAELMSQIQLAVVEALAEDNWEWADALMRATPDDARSHLDQWKKTHDDSEPADSPVPAYDYEGGAVRRQQPR